MRHGATPEYALATTLQTHLTVASNVSDFLFQDSYCVSTILFSVFFLPESNQEAFASSPNLVSSGLLVEISATTEPLAVDLRPINLQVFAGMWF